MKKNKRTLKGFTLIELIIVLAIFSVIMTLVMSFIDPVSRLMKKTSLRERSISYVDNIGEYVDNSLRYAKFVQVCDHEFFEIGDPGNYTNLIDYSIGDATDRQRNTERRAVESFAKTFFEGARDSDGNPLEGEVRVLEFINNSIGSLDSGMIYESSYHFRAGDPDDTNGAHPEYKNFSLTENYVLKQVVNQEHKENYDFYFRLGFWNLKAINDPGSYTDTSTAAALEPEAGSYYSSLVRMDTSTGNIGPLPTQIRSTYLPINIVAYTNDGTSKVTAEHSTDAGTETIPVFKSPSFMNTVSLTLINAINAVDSRSEHIAAYYRIKYDTVGGVKVPKTDLAGNIIYEAVPINTLPVFSYDEATPSDSENFYIIYVLPYEVYDSAIVLN